MQNQKKGYSETCSQAAIVKTTLEPPIQVKPLDDKANRADTKKLCVKTIPKTNKTWWNLHIKGNGMDTSEWCVFL